MDKYYTGIGSRKAPDDALTKAKLIGRLLCEAGWILRSGGADGMDSAFEAGCDEVNSRSKQIFLPWHKFNNKVGFVLNDAAALEIAKRIHPAWGRCSFGAKKLHQRNIHQVLGPTLDKPSNVVICWTMDGKLAGGTRTALVLAMEYNVPIINLASESYLHMAAEQIVDEALQRALHC